jgi:HKD family nuclease
MAVVLSGDRLRSRLQELVKISQRIDIAVAWVTDWPGLDDVLSIAELKHRDSIRILTGVSGYITSPDALDKIRQRAQLRVYGDATGVLFHPKLYIFHTTTDSVVWIGSANLTRPAFEENVELVAEQANDDGEIVAYFQGLWESDASSDQFDLARYRKNWKDERKKRPKFLDREAGINEEVRASKDIFDGEWKRFSGALNKTSDLSAAMNTIEEGHKFVRRNWADELGTEDAPIMFGLRRKPFSHFGFLDQIYNRHRQDFVGPSAGASISRDSISQALAPLLAAKELDLNVLASSFDQLMAIPHCGRALATRLLLFTRPDSCVVLNKKSARWLAGHFKIKLPEKPKGEQYAALIAAIQLRDWWRSPMSSDGQNERVWKYRAALIDRFAFEDYERRM